MEKVDIAILGSGIAGLGAAFRAREKNLMAVIYEARNSSGGLLDNFEINGFRFDHAVHLSFATEEIVRNIFDKTPFKTHPSDSFCFEEKNWLKHPIQNNLFLLPADIKVDLIKSFINRPENLAGDDYESWLRHQYGDLIAERYPIKYTKKYWDTDPKKLSTTWIGSRMRRSALEEVLYGAFTIDTPNTYYTKEMRYPLTGGYKSFIKPLIENSDIKLNYQAISVDSSSKLITFKNGTVVSYQSLISTLPLPVIVKILEKCPADVIKAANRLTATSIDLISIGFKAEIIKNLWFYIYDEDIYASRAHSPSVKSADNAPTGHSSLQFEVYSRGCNSKYSVEQIKENCLYALKKMGISNGNDVIFMDHRRIKYGNVIFDTGMENDRKLVRDYLKYSDISSCGRFGEWDYLWSNQSFISGYESIV